MKNLVWKIVIILAALLICANALYPPEKKIRLGKDLKGGTSLIYAVNLPPNATNREALIAQTIDVLKNRINPNGVLDISMQPLGLDRIEVVMPLPNEAVKDLSKQYQDALDELMRAAKIVPSELDAAVRAGNAVSAYGGAGLGGRMEQLQQAYVDVEKARVDLERQKAESKPAEDVNRAEQAVADAEDAYAAIRESILNTNLEQARVVRTLALSRNPTPVLDNRGEPVVKDGQAVTGASARDVALESLKKDFSHLTPLIDKTVAAHDVYEANRTALDDPEDLIRLMRGAGVLEFRIAVKAASPAEGVDIRELRDQLHQRGPDATDSTRARWFPINDLKQWYKTPDQLPILERDPQGYFANRFGLVGDTYEGQYYMLLYTTRDRAMTHDAESKWTILQTQKTQDQLGRPAVSFHLDQGGGTLMSRLTGAHVKEQMAIVLDGQVYSAPNLNSQIGSQGIIEGDFSAAELDYLIRVLASGALEARLSERPIAINTVGPTLGRENLTAGLRACLYSIIAVAGFMLVYYFQAGLIAIIGMGLNAIMIFGVMAMIDGTFTLPGLAGIALTLCTAVDANILIYERIREELETGEVDLRGAVRLGYKRAFSTILDANVTNLIVCIALMQTATTEVKGFALTLLIGILGTLFAALFITRTMFQILIEVFNVRRLPMLATTFPAVRRALEPNLNWISMRGAFISVSAVLILASLVLLGIRGESVFDTEFRGGLSATMHTTKDAQGQPLLLRQSDVKERIRQIGRDNEKLPDSDQTRVLRELANAEVLTVGESKTGSDGSIEASAFQVKVAIPPVAGETSIFKDTIVDAIVTEFKKRNELDVTTPIAFAGTGTDALANSTYPVTSARLDEVIKRAAPEQDISRYSGGAAIVLDGLTPPATEADLKDRITRMRKQPDFTSASGREFDVIGLTVATQAGNPAATTYSSAVVLVADPKVNYGKVEYDQWESRLARGERDLVAKALSRPATLEQVSEFSSAVAATLRAKATVAVALSLLGILVYIWIRFGSLRYSAGAVAALFHDAIIGLGAVALSQMIGETAFGKALLIEPFHIQMEVLAAVLTLMGYSLNDTIVILDRIRENRGKLQFPTAETVNKSINQTFSRTMLTSLTIFISLIIMYVVGGPGIRAFCYVMLVGMFVGTYSSIAIAAPMVFKGHDEPGLDKKTGTTQAPKPMAFAAPTP